MKAARKASCSTCGKPGHYAPGCSRAAVKERLALLAETGRAYLAGRSRVGAVLTEMRAVVS